MSAEAVALADRVIVLDEGRIALDIAVPQPRPRAARRRRPGGARGTAAGHDFLARVKRPVDQGAVVSTPTASLILNGILIALAMMESSRPGKRLSRSARRSEISRLVPRISVRVTPASLSLARW